MVQPATTQNAQGMQEQGADRGVLAPRTFLSEQSVGSVIRNTMALYRSNFRPLFLAYILPTFPVLVLQQVVPPSVLLFAIAIVGWIISFVAIGALTVTISDLCLGNQPSVRRSYEKVLKGGGWLRLLWTGVLQTLAMLLGILLLVIPGLILAIRLIVCSTVVVLDGESGLKALKRSMFLTKGQFWRLSGILGLVSLLVFAVAILGMLAIGATLGIVEAMAETGFLAIAIAVLIDALIQGFLYPLMLIAIVLMYYDLRARKEAYDVEALSEDMMR